MNQKIKLSQGIQYVIAGLALLVFLLIWPAGIIQKVDVSKSDEVQLQDSDPISVENNGTQMFIAEGKYLKAVDLYVVNNMQSETITFRIYDGAYQQLWETFYVVDEKAKFPGFIRIEVGMEMEEGWEYYYTVEGLTADLVMGYEDTYNSTSFANGTFLYGGEEMPGINLIARYVYAENYSWWMTIAFGLLLFALVKGSGILIDKLFGKKWADKDKEITVQFLIQCIANPVIGVVTLAALLAVFPGRVFGTGVVNYGFYYLGILLCAAVLLFGVNYKRKGMEPLITKEIINEHWQEWAMAVCFAGVLWSCYEYMNGLYDIHHSYATCKLLTWFGLAVLCTLSKKDLLNIWNLVYLIPACIGGYFYAKPYFGVVEKDELYKLQAYVMIVGGLVILHLLISLIRIFRKKQKITAKVNLPYAGCLVLLLGLMVVFRNTREWPVLTAVIFALFYYRMWVWEKRERLMQIFCNGIILNFLYTVGYCLVHRPYMRYRFNRFGMTFHTVTMTGYYLALVLCAVMVRLFVQYRKTKRWQDCWKELSLLGIGNAYLFLTLSRTGYLAAYIMEVCFCIFMVLVWEKKKLIGILKKLAMVLAVTVLFFPIVFTAQRIMPAVCNDPIYSEIEIWEYTVEKGERKDSELYIDIQYFIKLASYKLFGYNPGNFSAGDSMGINEPEGNMLCKLWEEPMPVYVAGQSFELAAAIEDMESDYDVSNGRFEIFREYIGHWNMTGHEDMGVLFPDGGISAHAHNSYLQVIHDHGLITGVIFLIFGVATFFLGIYKYIKEKKKDPYCSLTLAVIFAFALAACVEWIFHICNPFGFSVFVVIVPLLFTKKKQKTLG